MGVALASDIPVPTAEASWRPAETELTAAARMHSLAIPLPHTTQKQEPQITIALPSCSRMQTMPRI